MAACQQSSPVNEKIDNSEYFFDISSLPEHCIESAKEIPMDPKNEAINNFQNDKKNKFISYNDSVSNQVHVPGIGIYNSISPINLSDENNIFISEEEDYLLKKYGIYNFYIPDTCPDFFVIRNITVYNKEMLRLIKKN